MPRNGRYTCYRPHQRRQQLLVDHSVRFPNDVLFLDPICQGDLQQVGCFLRARSCPGHHAPLRAVQSGSLACVRLLVRHRADIQQRAEAGWTAQHVACRRAP